MKSGIYIGGTGKSVGKTWVSLGVIAQLRAWGRVGAWKPIDTGAMVYNAADVLSDGEALYQASGMTTHPSLSNPFLLNEDLPPELAARRDGCQFNLTVLENYAERLGDHFDFVVTEGGRGLALPLAEGLTELELLKRWQPRIVWVCGIGEDELAATLLQVKMLLQTGLIVVGIVLNNPLGCKHGDLLHYQWLTLEEQLGIRVAGILPRLELLTPEPALLAQWLTANLEADFLKQWLGLE